jgi:predicted phosphodiesterase
MRSARALAWVLGLLLTLGASARAEVSPPGLKVAFLGDQGLGPAAWAVLELVRDEGADAVLHLGDFDYADQPLLWEAQIDGILGHDFPYFAVAGNHDVDAFEGSLGYQDLMQARLHRLGIPFEGDLGRQSTIRWKGLLFVLVAPSVFGPGDGFHDRYLRERLLQDLSVWRIAAWHENMRLMQVGGKGDSTGWGVYEQARRGGAIVATAHEHSYSRSFLLDRMPDARVASTSNTLVLTRDLPWTPRDEGRSFVFVSGLGGASIRDQELTGAHWASVYTSDQGATFGALFGVFHVDGDPRRARFYFKDLRGDVVDEFFVESPDGRESDACSDGLDNDADGLVDHDGGRGAGLTTPTAPDPECDGRPGWTREDLAPCGSGFALAVLAPLVARVVQPRERVAPAA